MTVRKASDGTGLSGTVVEAEVLDGPAAAFDGAGGRLASVTTGPDGAFQNLKPGAVFIDNTTASADVARELYAAAKARGAAFLDAPVSGGQAGAENGQLTVMVGGMRRRSRARSL